MTLQQIYGMIADIAFYLTCSSPAVLLIILLVGAEASVYLPALVIMIAAAASCALREKGAKRFLPLIILPLALILSQNILVAIWAFPAIVYVLISAIKNSYIGLFPEFGDFFKIAACIVPVIGMLVNIQPVANGWDMGTSVLSVVFLCAGISKLRYMRQTKNVLHNSRAFHISNIVMMSAIILGTAMITAALAFGAEQIGNIGINLEGGRYDALEKPDKLPKDEVELNPDAAQSEEKTNKTESDGDKNMTAVQVILLVGIIGAVSYIAVRMIKKRPENKLHEENVRVLDNENALNTHNTKQLRERTNRDSIRRIYRRFLKHLDSKDIKIEKHHTSKEINDLAKYAANKDEPYDELRKLYAKARYDNDSCITREHVLRMRELYNAAKRSV